jgi:hypothetical protein
MIHVFFRSNVQVYYKLVYGFTDDPLARKIEIDNLENFINNAEMEYSSTKVVFIDTFIKEIGIEEVAKTNKIEQRMRENEYIYIKDKSYKIKSVFVDLDGMIYCKIGDNNYSCNDESKIEMERIKKLYDEKINNFLNKKFKVKLKEENIETKSTENELDNSDKNIFSKIVQKILGV